MRIGGVAGVAAGAAYYAVGVADLLLLAPETRWPGPVVLASSSECLVQALLVAGLAGTPVAVAGLLMRARWRRARGRGRGRLWAVGSSAVLLGHALLLLSALATLARGAATGPDPFAVVGYPLALFGAVVLGVTAVVLDARVLPRWCGLLLVFGYPLTVLPGASWAGTWMMLGSVWASVGYALLLSGRELPRAPRGRNGTVRGRRLRRRRASRTPAGSARA